mgnify:CR=1 FL=1
MELPIVDDAEGAALEAARLLAEVASRGGAIALESWSFRTAIVESRPLKGNGTWWQFIRQSKVPELPVVLLDRVVELGFDAVDTYVPWTVHMPAPGESDWGEKDPARDLAAFARLCQERGLLVSLRPGPATNRRPAGSPAAPWSTSDR